jgi:hypothetical protein
MGDKVKLKLAALFFLLPLSALAQSGPAKAGRSPKPAAALGASFFYSSPDGIISRRSGLSGEAALGSAAGFKLRASAGLAHLRNTAGGYFPGQLYKAGFGLTAEREGTRLALHLDSNSDRPFYSPSETDLGFTYSSTFSEKNGSAWLWGLNYSTRRSFARGMPLPFISYRYTSENFMFVVPFMARWQASRTLALSASYQPVKYFKLGLNWRPLPFLRAELEGGTALEQFLIAGRSDKSTALFYEASYVTLKPSLMLSRGFELTPALGWQFNGLYYTGARYDDYKAKTRLRGGPSFGLSARYFF